MEPTRLDNPFAPILRVFKEDAKTAPQLKEAHYIKLRSILKSIPIGEISKSGTRNDFIKIAKLLKADSSTPEDIIKLVEKIENRVVSKKVRNQKTI